MEYTINPYFIIAAQEPVSRVMPLPSIEPLRVEPVSLPQRLFEPKKLEIYPMPTYERSTDVGSLAVQCIHEQRSISLELYLERQKEREEEERKRKMEKEEESDAYWSGYNRARDFTPWMKHWEEAGDAEVAMLRWQKRNANF